MAEQQATSDNNAAKGTASEITEHWLVSLLRPLKGRFVELGSITFFINLLALAVPIFTLQVYDRVVFHGGLTTLQGLVIGVFIAVGFDFILREVRAKLVQRSAMRIDVEISRRLFRKLTALPLRVLERQSTPFWQMTYRDAEAVRDTIAGAPTVLLIDLPFVLVFMIIIYFIAAPIAWLLLIIVPAFMVLAFFSSRAINKSTEAERQANLDRDALLAELLSGRTSVKALNLGSELRDRWETRQGVTVTRGITRRYKRRMHPFGYDTFYDNPRFHDLGRRTSDYRSGNDHGQPNSSQHANQPGHPTYEPVSRYLAGVSTPEKQHPKADRFIRN